jgi:hypothetical protein
MEVSPGDNLPNQWRKTNPEANNVMDFLGY